jgi:hypothetical protein
MMMMMMTMRRQAMSNMIEMASEVGASVHEVGEHNSVIVFTEGQLNAFINKVDEEASDD